MPLDAHFVNITKNINNVMYIIYLELETLTGIFFLKYSTENIFL